MRPLRNIKPSQKSFSFSRKASSATAHTPVTDNTAHQFFNPSYISPKDLIRIDELSHSSNFHSSSNSKSKKSIFKYVAPVLSITKNYHIENNQNNNSTHIQLYNPNDFSTINNLLLKSINHLGSSSSYLNTKDPLSSNKNKQYNITVDLISPNKTVVNIRRKNSNIIKKISITAAKPNEPLNERRALVSSSRATNVKSKPLYSDQRHYCTSTDPADYEEYLHQDQISLHIKLIDEFMALEKFSEVLPLFIRMRNNEILPNLTIYNKVLFSITKRTNESVESNLTNLLNVYSDLINNNIKPNNVTYEIIINHLLNGSIIAYNENNFKNSFDFFKISLDLFFIKDHEKFEDNNIYLNLLKCCNFFRYNEIKPSEMLQLLENKIELSNTLSFYLLMIRYSVNFNDLAFIEKLYTEKIKCLKLNENDKHQILQSLIESYNLLGNYKKSSILIDSIVNSKQDAKIIEPYLSIYLKSLSLSNPQLAYQMLHKFNESEWLPKISIHAQLILLNQLVLAKDLKTSLNLFEFLLLRKDFDESFKKAPRNDNYNIVSIDVLDNLVDLVLDSKKLNLVMQLTRLILIKNSLKINNEQQLLQLVSFLEKSPELKFKFIINQGYKKLINKESINNYFSLIIDLMSSDEVTKLFGLNFFRHLIKNFSLTNDNFYGLLKSLKLVESQASTQQNIATLLLEFKRELLEEFNEIDNTYINLPREIEAFKRSIESELLQQNEQ